MAASAGSRIIDQVSEPEPVRPRIVRTSPVVPKERYGFAASSGSVLRIMRNPRLPEIGLTTSGGSGQGPCCLECIEDICGATGR